MIDFNGKEKLWVYYTESNEYILYIDKKIFLVIEFDDDMNNFTYNFSCDMTNSSQEEQDSFVNREVQFLKKEKENILKY